MKILFVCKHNRFRSKMAEAYFKKINRNKKVEIASAGLFKGFPVADSVVEVGKKLGIRINKNTKTIKEEFLIKQDLIIIVANNIPVSVFDDRRIKKVVVWKIPDTDQRNKKRIEQIGRAIMKRVDKLNKSLERK